MSWTTLRPAVKAKLDSLTGVGQKIAQVLDVHTGNITQFPAVTFEPSSNENEFFSNTDNLRSYQFDIYVHQEITRPGRDVAIDILTGVVDDIIEAFDTDYNLGGAADFCEAMPSVWGEYTGEHGAIKYAQLTIICKIEKQVIT